MVDINLIKNNPEGYKKAAMEKNINFDPYQLIKLYEAKNELQQKVDTLRKERNELAASMKTERTDEKIARGKEIKEEVANLEESLKKIEKEYLILMCQAPTIHATDTPIAKDESGNVEAEVHGTKPKFDFTPKDHAQIGKICDIIDLEKGVDVAGYRGYYIKNEGVMLMMGFLMYALQKLNKKGFQPMIPPTLVKGDCLFGSGYFAGTEYDPEVDEIYQISNKDKTVAGEDNKEKKFLVGTAEPSLLAYYANKTLKEEDLPIKHCGYSQCYRSEIGSYGKDTKGMYRVHEFMKIEQVVISPADIDISDQLQQEMVSISKELHEDLGLPYRVLRICSGDMPAGKYKMFDLEAWMPGRDGYGETGSASNFVDWQSRRLNAKYITKDGEKKHVYMLNNTALPSPRIFIAILENYQQADGSIVVPEVLRPFVGKDVIEAKM